MQELGIIMLRQKTKLFGWLSYHKKEVMNFLRELKTTWQQGWNTSSAVIMEVSPNYEETEVWDIEMPTHHNFFVNGHIVHNCHYIKNLASQRTWDVLNYIYTHKPKVLAMSGTVQTIGHQDVLPQALACYNPCGVEGRTLKEIAKNMQDRYFPYVKSLKMARIGITDKRGRKIDSERKPMRASELAYHLKETMITVTEEEAGFKSTKSTPKIVTHQLTEQQRLIIKKLIEDGAKLIDDTTFVKRTVFSIQQVLDGICPVYDIDSDSIVEYRWIETYKTDKLDQLMALIPQDKQVLVFVKFRETLKMLREKYPNWAYRIGGEDCEKQTVAFKEGRYRVMLATIDSSSTGLDFPDVDYIVYYSITTSLEKMIQSEARIRRLSSTGIKHYFYILDKKFGYQLFQSTQKKENDIQIFRNLVKTI